MRGDLYEMDLVLRNNITTDEHPLGVYHPHSEYHHIKKENIGLIEVMGMAILPARLRLELAGIGDIIENHLDEEDDTAIEHICDALKTDDALAVHEEWIRQILSEDMAALRKDAKEDNEAVTSYLRRETGKVFSHVLENAGVYKQTPEGLAGFKRFLDQL
jgi:UDPglucose--hexose-1-phosphate uridylyltransferase